MSVSDEVGKGFDRISQGLDKLASSANGIDLDDLVKALKEATGVAGGSNFKTLADQLTKVEEAVNKVNTSLKKLNKSSTGDSGLGNFESTIKSVTNSIDALSKKSGTLTKIVDTINGLKKFEYRTSGSKKITAGIGELNKDLKTTAERLETVIKKVGELQSWMAKINSTGGFNVKVNNKGFSSIINVMQEMEKAINNFNARKGNDRRNFFEVAFGTNQDNKKEANKLVEDARNTVKEIKATFGTEFGDSIKKKLQQAIKNGITEGVKEGLNDVNVAGNSNMMSFLESFSKSTKLSQYQKGDMFQAIARMNGAPIDPWLIKQEEMKNENIRFKISETLKTKEQINRDNKSAELNALFDMNPEEIKKAAEAYAQIWITKLQMVTKQYEDLVNREKQGREARENYYKDLARFQQEFQQYQGRELTNYDKIKLKAGAVVEKWEELRKRAENNKYDQSQLYNLMERMVKVTRELAEETYKVSKGYDQIKERAAKVHKVLSGFSQVFNRASQSISFFGQFFSTVRAQAQNLFGYLRNSIRSLTSQLRGQLSSALSDGIDQFKQMEAAKISFDQFFGADRSEDVIAEVRKQALQTPIVTSGELADYVSQLAPVSNGNASLAINASLGALKAIAASGSSTADMEYVVKNIRDVISKGKATAIDIRQFNRAMPALEQFIEKMGLTEFLSDDGDQRNLSITSENVGRVLDMFAHLNTDEDSPIKDINEQQLTTLEGMLQLMKERKTTMVENVLKNGGVFDFVKKVLGVGSSASLWDSMEKFFTKHVKNIMRFVNSINWSEIGQKLSEGGERIGKALRNAYNEITTIAKNVAGIENASQAFDTLWSVIESFINGFKEGVKETLAAYNKLKGVLGEDTIKALATSIGYLVSPMGKIISSMITLTRQFVGFMGNMFGVMDSVTKSGYSNKLKSIEAAAGKYADRITGAANVKSLQQLIEQKGSSFKFYGESVVSGSEVYKGGSLVAGGWENMSVGQKMNTVGGWNYVKGTISSVGSKIVTIGSAILKCVGQVALVSAISGGVKSILGAGDGTITGSFINGLTGAFTGGKIAGAIGSALGIAGLGPVGAMAGAVLGVVIPYVNNLKREREERQRRASDKVNIVIDQDKEDWVQKIIKLYNENGGDLDEGSSEGKYAADILRRYADDNDLKDLSSEEGLKKLANAQYFAKMSSKIADIDDTDKWKELYDQGRMISDWDAVENREIRTRLVELAKEWKLLGTPIEERTDENGNKYTVGEYDYTLEDEQIVRDLLAAQDEQLSEAQFNFLMDEANRIQGDVKSTTLDIFTEIRDNMQPQIQSIDNYLKNIAADVAILAHEENTDKTKDEGVNEQERRVRQLEAYGKNDLKTFMGADSTFFTDNRLGTSDLSLISVKNMSASDDVKSTDLFKNPSWTAIYDFLDGQYKNTMAQHKELSEAVKNAGDGASEGLKRNLDLSTQRMNDILDLADELKSLPNTARAYVDFLTKLRESYSWMFQFAGGVIPKKKGGMAPIFRAGGGPARGVDVVPAMLQPGEFVVRRSGVARAGLSALTALNRGDLMTAARSLGSRAANNSYNNSRNWSNVVNNNQRSAVNNIRIFNRNNGTRLNSYHSLANRIALA